MHPRNLSPTLLVCSPARELATGIVEVPCGRPDAPAIVITGR